MTISGMFRKASAMSLNDIKNIFRDSTLMLLLLAPVLIIILFRFAIPLLSDLLLENTGFDLSEHYPFIASFTILLPPMLYGFMNGFIILDERDENILTYFMITPLSRSGYLIFRMFSMVPICFILCFMILSLTGLCEYTFGSMIPVAFLTALQAPIFSLFLASFAGNKVEGLAIGKGMGILLMAPLAAYLIPSKWHYLAGLAPQFWTSRMFLSAQGQIPGYLMYFLGGLLLTGLYYLILIHKFNNRMT